jgi:hypothetical protein
VEAPYLEVVDSQSTHSPAFHGECPDGETSDRDRTHGHTPKSDSAQCGRAYGDGATRARLDLSYFTAVNLHFIHGAPRVEQ